MNITRTVKVCLALTILLTIGGCLDQQKTCKPDKINFTSTVAGLIKVMTFNIRVDTFIDGWNRWKNRKEMVFETLQDNAADVIGLQEALDIQVQQIQQALPQYKNYAVSRNDGKKKGESCAIFYRKDRFKLADSGTFWFSDTPSEPGSKDWGNLPPRICSWVRLYEKSTNSHLYVYNVHLDNLSQNSRRKSILLLSRKIATRKHQDPFIVMGDFNMELDNPAMEFLLECPYPKMVDSWQSVHPDYDGTGTRHNFSGSTSGPKIDHIPISDQLKAIEVKVDRRKINGKYPSDHFPVIAEILMENSHG